MSKSPEIRVNPELLIWARETSGIDVSTVAKRLSVQEELIESWERGEKPITYLRLEGLADIYQRPVASLFLPSAPPDFVTPTDFRTSEKNLTITPELRRAVRHARVIRNTFFQINPDYKKFQREKIGLTEDPEKIAAIERDRLGISFETQKGWHVGKESYDNWVKLLEDNGIIILQKSFPREELSGFSLNDDEKAPVIVINSNDVYPRRIFTLFHEYCHLLLHSTGVCKLKSESIEFKKNTSVESFCDKFASSFLVPNDILFGREEIENLSDKQEADKYMRRLANLFKVSRQVILLRLFLHNKISKKYYDEKKSIYDNEFAIFLKKKKDREKESKGGPLPHFMAVSQNGKLYTRTVLKAYRSGHISTKEVASYLGVKLRHLPSIESII